jgi:hypothetical protein
MYNTEDEIMAFCHDFCKYMGWPYIDIIRIKVNKMARYMGFCIPDTQSDGVYILLSELTNETNKQFFSTVIHELIHAHILCNLGRHDIAHKHGKLFRKIAKQVEHKTRGYYTRKAIV